MTVIVTFLDFLSSRYPPTLTIEQVGEITSEHSQTIRNRLSEGKYHIPSFKVGSKRLFKLIDVAEFIERQSAADPSHPGNKHPRRGRPTKVEQMARQQAARQTAHTDARG